MQEKQTIISMFSRIAQRYDLANRLLSLGFDRYWRWRIVQAVKPLQPKLIIDFATGSGDVAFTLRKGLGTQPRIIGMDFCQPMLDEAEKKQAHAPSSQKIEFMVGDCLNPPCAPAIADVATIAFGVRNFENRAAGLRGIYNTLKPGGRFVILESSQPYGWFRGLYFTYLRHIMPRIAKLITGDISAYEYLADSIEAFPTASALAKELKAIGFINNKFYRLTLGIVALHIAEKP